LISILVLVSHSLVSVWISVSLSHGLINIPVNRLKRLHDRTAMDNREQFFNRTADDAEAVCSERAAYSAVKVLGGYIPGQHSGVPMHLVIHLSQKKISCGDGSDTTSRS